MTEEELELWRKISDGYSFLTFNPPAMKVKYIDRRGNEFDNEHQAMESDRHFAREDYYNHLLANRNWFQRLFNIKPDMSFYDEMEFKSRFYSKF